MSNPSQSDLSDRFFGTTRVCPQGHGRWSSGASTVGLAADRVDQWRDANLVASSQFVSVLREPDGSGRPPMDTLSRKGEPE